MSQAGVSAQRPVASGAAGHGVPDTDEPAVESLGRPRLDLVSPLPPVRSGIADYSADLLPALAQRADVRLVDLGEAPIPASVSGGLTVVEADHLAEEGRLPLYQMGNNHYHEQVYRLAMETPGVLVLHDLVLHHFLIGRTAGSGHNEAYRHVLAAEHGWIGDAAARLVRWPGGESDAAKFALPANRRLLRRQRGVLTHSVWARDMLLESLPGLAVEAIAMGVPVPPAIDEASGLAFRQRHGIPARAPLLGSFGFQTPIKRTDVILQALAEPELATAWLVIGGEMVPGSELVEKAEALGVNDRVRFLGYLPFDELEAAIAAVDLCLNLRYPTAGETSASLLRTLALGRPAVVSDYAQSSDLSDHIVVKIPVGEGEAAALLCQLADLLRDRERLSAMGLAARQHMLDHHQPADAAAAVVAACERWRDAEPLGDRPATPPNPTSMTLVPLTCALNVRLFPHDGGPAGGITVAANEDCEYTAWQPGSRCRFVVDLVNESEGVWLAGERGAGGVALEVRMVTGGKDYMAQSSWPGLPVDLAPGDRHRFQFTLRRPLVETQIRIEPHVLGREGFSCLGGKRWDRRFS